MNCQKCSCILPEGVTCCPNCGTFVQTQTSINQQQPIQNNINQQGQQPQNIPQQVQQQPMNQFQQQIPGVAQQNVPAAVPNQGIIQQNIQIQQPMINTTPQTISPPMQQQIIPGQGVPVSNNIQPSQTKQSIEVVEEKPKKKKVFFIILIMIVALIAASVFLYPKIKEKFNKLEVTTPDKLYDTTSFWIVNNDKKAAIFNIDGEQLSEFIYTEASAKFVNNTAYVKNENNEYAIINSNGKEIVKFGKYKKITDISAAYIAETEDKRYFLYNRAGKLVKELGSNPIPFGLQTSSSGSTSYLSIGVFDNNQFTIINYAGEELLSIPFVENEHTVDTEGNKKTPRVFLYQDKYLSLFYNQHNYILDIDKKEVIIDFESPLYFVVTAANEEKNEIFLNSVTQQSGWNRDENKIFEYKLVRNKKIVYTNSHDYDIKYVYYNNGIIEFIDVLSHYILTETGDKISISGNAYIAGYTDYNNYVKVGENRVKEIYVNHELKNVYNCRQILTGDRGLDRYAKFGLYVLKECEGYKDEDGYSETRDIIIKPDGTILNDKSYQYVSAFDSNGNLTVSEDGKTGYLIDNTGKKISKDFYTRTSYNYEYHNGDIEKFSYNDYEKDLYIGMNEDETETLFNINGKEYITANSIDNTYNEISKDTFALLEYDDYYVVYNVTKQKDVLKTKEEPDCYEEYIKIDYDNKREYYSYSTGKLFYTLER